MNKNEYLSALARWLRELPEDERKKQLAYYSEMYDDMLEDGLSPAGAAARLGEPVTLAAEILSALGYTLPPEEEGAAKPPKKKKNRALWLVPILVLAALLLRWGWAALAGLVAFGTVRTVTETVEETEDLFPSDGKVYSLTAERIHSIRVDWPDGSVTVLPGESDKLVFTHSGAGVTADLEWKTDDGTLYIDTGWRLFGAGNAGHLQILIPQSLAENLQTLPVETASASIAVQQIAVRELELDSTSGAIEVTDTAAVTADLDSASGRISYGGSAGCLAANTVSGRIRAELTGGGDELHLNSTSGAITARAESLREISAETTSGRVELSVADLSLLQEVEVDTVSGGVELAFPGDGEITVDFDSLSGRMTSDFVSGARGTEVDVSTVSGHLSLRADDGLLTGVRGPDA